MHTRRRRPFKQSTVVPHSHTHSRVANAYVARSSHGAHTVETRASRWSIDWADGDVDTLRVANLCISVRGTARFYGAEKRIYGRTENPKTRRSDERERDQRVTLNVTSEVTATNWSARAPHSRTNKRTDGRMDERRTNERTDGRRCCAAPRWTGGTRRSRGTEELAKLSRRGAVHRVAPLFARLAYERNGAERCGGHLVRGDAPRIARSLARVLAFGASVCSGGVTDGVRSVRPSVASPCLLEDFPRGGRVGEARGAREGVSESGKSGRVSLTRYREGFYWLPPRPMSREAFLAVARRATADERAR